MRYNFFGGSKSRIVSALALSAGLCGGAKAATTTITFAPQNAETNSPFVSDAESGFTVVPTTMDAWFVGQLFGNAVPSIFDGPIDDPTTAGIQVAEGGADFTFASLDEASNGDVSNFVIVGFTGGTPAFTEMGQFAASGGGFTTYSSTVGDSTIPISTLDVTIVPFGGANSVNLDNIVLGTPVPEPTSVSIGLGLAALGLQRRRRRAR